MKKKKQAVKNAPLEQNEFDGLHKNKGETIFTIFMSVMLVGIVIFYSSLPLQAAAYHMNLNTQLVDPQSVVDDLKTPTTDTDELIDEEASPETEDNNDSEATPETDDKTDQDTSTEDDDKADQDASSEDDDKADQDASSEDDEEAETKPETEKPTGGVKQYAKITYDGLNVRAGSTVNTETVGKAYVGEEYELLQLMSEIKWAKIMYKGEEAFVHTDFIDIIKK